MSTRLPILSAPPYSTDRAVLEGEVRVDVYRASGPGGQHVNKTNSAIRLTHLPSGVVVISQDSSSQYRNRETAFERLIERLIRKNFVPKKRTATKPTRASQERRITEKKNARGGKNSAPEKNLPRRMNIITVHLSITGRVQGVGYRESMRMVAQALDVTGWVRNREDDSVEAVLQGDEPMVERLIAWCHNGPPGANVKYVESILMQTEESFIAFSRLPNG